MPAELVPRTVPVLTDSRAQPFDLDDERLTIEGFEVFVHRAIHRQRMASLGAVRGGDARCRPMRRGGLADRNPSAAWGRPFDARRHAATGSEVTAVPRWMATAKVTSDAFIWFVSC
jgi:hypothetical protein